MMACRICASETGSRAKVGAADKMMNAAIAPTTRGAKPIARSSPQPGLVAIPALAYIPVPTSAECRFTTWLGHRPGPTGGTREGPRSLSHPARIGVSSSQLAGLRGRMRAGGRLTCTGHAVDLVRLPVSIMHPVRLARHAKPTDSGARLLGMTRLRPRSLGSAVRFFYSEREFDLLTITVAIVRYLATIVRSVG